MEKHHVSLLIFFIGASLCFVPVAIKRILWFRYRIYHRIAEDPKPGDKWAFPDLNPRWPPHSFSIVSVEDGLITFISDWIKEAPSLLTMPTSSWKRWAKDTRAYPVGWKPKEGEKPLQYNKKQ